MGAWPEPALVVLVQELRLVCGHVDADRAVAGARLAGKTQIESIFNGLVFPAVLHHFSTDHFIEQSRPPARGMLFFTRDHITWTHRATFSPAANAGSDTSVGCRGEVVGVLFQLRAVYEFIAHADKRVFDARYGLGERVEAAGRYGIAG